MHRAPSDKPPRRGGMVFAAISAVVVLGTGIGLGAHALSSSSSTPRPYTPAPVTARPFHHAPTSAATAPKPFPSQVIATTPGMTLWALAVKDCGSGYDWPALYKANRALIGPDPGMLAVGETLTIKCH